MLGKGRDPPQPPLKRLRRSSFAAGYGTYRMYVRTYICTHVRMYVRTYVRPYLLCFAMLCFALLCFAIGVLHGERRTAKTFDQHPVSDQG